MDKHFPSQTAPFFMGTFTNLSVNLREGAGTSGAGAYVQCECGVWRMLASEILRERQEVREDILWPA